MMDGMMSDPQELIGREIDQFLILDHIARGGMADLFLARDVKLDRLAALKLILPALAQMPEFNARFQREARATARINQANVVQIYTNGMGPGGRPYIALEYIPGGSLADRLQTHYQKNEPMDAVQALAVGHDVALGLRVAHEAGIVHRDLKPSNILLREDGSAVLSDLGIAAMQFEATRLTRTGTMQGTPQYMAPEQAKADVPVDARSDIYALGVILHELLAGSPPFDAQSPWGIIHQHINEPPPALEKLRPGLAPATYSVVSTCLKKEPSQRYQTAGELAIALERAIDAQQAGNDSPGPVVIPRFLRYLASVAVLLLLILLIWPRLSEFLTSDSGPGPVPSAEVTVSRSLPTAMIVVETGESALVTEDAAVGGGPQEATAPAKATSTRVQVTPPPADTPTLIPTLVTEHHYPGGLVAYACDTTNGYQIRLSDPATGELVSGHKTDRL